MGLSGMTLTVVYPEYFFLKVGESETGGGGEPLKSEKIGFLSLRYCVLPRLVSKF
jgi:hypothetical protein